MVITNYGEGCIRIQNGETVLLVDPTTARLKADVTLRTITRLEEAPTPEQNVITFAGEYEGAGIGIQGWQCGSDSASVTTAYVISWDGIRVAIVGDHDALPQDDALEGLEQRQPHVLILPMSTKGQVSWAAKLAKQLEAALIIPTTYASIADVRSVFSEAAEEEKITFKHKELLGMQQRVVVLTKAQ